MDIDQHLKELIGLLNQTFASPYLWVQTLCVLYVVSRALVPLEDLFIKYNPVLAVSKLIRYAFSSVFQWCINLPIVKPFVKREVDKVLNELESEIIQRGGQFPEHHKLPTKGLSSKEVERVSKKLAQLRHSKWQAGRSSGAVYHESSELLQLQTEMFGAQTFANQLHPDCFPEVRRMDAEVVAMVLDLYNAPPTGCGTTTSGGTESLLLASLAAREYAKKNNSELDLSRPLEIVAPVTVHAGFDKAAHYFGMRLVHAPIDKRTMQVNLKAVNNLIGPNTVLLVGSAPNFPHGIIDNIEGLSKLAQKHRLLLHVDACLGSFVVPFLSEVHNDAPLFDFRVPGVTSISCDTHKYGFAPKGSSVIMYRTPELRKCQYFVSTDWTGGLYASPTLAGSRPGALVAGCWATMLHMGRDGYLKSAKQIMEVAAKLKDALNKSELYFVYGDPKASVVAFGSHAINIYDLNDAMAKKGWHLSALQYPPAIHMAVTGLTHRSIDELIVDLLAVGKELANSGSTASSSQGTKALYGVAGSVRTAGIAGQLAEGFVDCLYKL